MTAKEPGNLPEKTVAKIEKKVVTDIHNRMIDKLKKIKGACPMTRHTPGEWKAVEQRSGKTTYIMENSGNKIICEIGLMSEQPPDQDKANARLIAAAPELLAACEWAFGELCEAWDEPEEKAIPEKFLTAIRKARGK